MARIKTIELDEAECRGPGVVVADLAALGLAIASWCHRCGHGATIPASLLVGAHGPHVAVADLGAAMHCQGCGSRDIATTATLSTTVAAARVA